MKFDQVYDRLLDYQTRRNDRFLVLREDTLREVYEHIVATGAKDCLELGTAYGATTCVMAAAIDEIGGGTVTTIDQIVRKPVGVAELAQITGVSRYVRAIDLQAGYNWFLLGVLREQTKGSVCEPCYDFCFLDGAHQWAPDALAALLATKLLRPGRWLMMDDLHFKLRDCHPGWEQAYGHMSDDELDTRQVGMVFDLLVKTQPGLGHFMLTNSGHIGWARKAGGAPVTWLPNGVIAAAVAGSWSRTYDAVAITQAARRDNGVVIEPQGSGVVIRSSIADPSITMATPVQPPRPIDYVTLRLRLLAPDLETVQLFWVGADDPYFDEARSARCIVRSLRAAQDLTFCIRGTPRDRTIGMLRIDPGDGPCEMVLERVTFGAW